MSTMTRGILTTVVLSLVIPVNPEIAAADDVIPRNPPLRWWKGNIHTHSLWSDGNDFTRRSKSERVHRLWISTSIGLGLIGSKLKGLRMHLIMRSG